MDMVRVSGTGAPLRVPCHNTRGESGNSITVGVISLTWGHAALHTSLGRQDDGLAGAAGATAPQTPTNKGGGREATRGPRPAALPGCRHHSSHLGGAN